MNNKYRIIETEHADGSFTYHPEIGKVEIFGKPPSPIKTSVYWEKIAPPCISLDDAKDEIQKFKNRQTVKNKMVYYEE